MKNILIPAAIGIISFFYASVLPAGSEIQIKGMTVSCQTWGWEWGSDEMVVAMRKLKTMGINWISIHPYAYVLPDGSIRPLSSSKTDNFKWLIRPIKEAHRLGLKMCIKPHIAYWGTKFKWRGDVTFNSESEWSSFFSSYADWLSDLVDRCSEADAFVVGTELDGTVSRESEWRELIARMRSSTEAPLTYAANWADYEKIRFWDALDAIGVQAYFPLADSLFNPDMEELEKSWNQHLRKLNAFAEEWDRDIVFTELGYDISANAAFKPWKSGRKNRLGAGIQEKCMKSALEAVGRNDRVIGAFIWKWFAGTAAHENFLASRPPISKLIKSYWSPGS